MAEFTISPVRVNPRRQWWYLMNHAGDVRRALAQVEGTQQLMRRAVKFDVLIDFDKSRLNPEEGRPLKLALCKLYVENDRQGFICTFADPTKAMQHMPHACALLLLAM
jgi:hypothetical protein